MGRGQSQGRSERDRISAAQKAARGPEIQPVKDSLYDRLLGFLSELDDLRIAYSLGHHRPEAIMVTVALPGERCEVEFLDDGSVDVERFVSSGELGGEALLNKLLAAHVG